MKHLAAPSCVTVILQPLEGYKHYVTGAVQQAADTCDEQEHISVMAFFLFKTKHKIVFKY